MAQLSQRITRSSSSSTVIKDVFKVTKRASTTTRKTKLELPVVELIKTEIDQDTTTVVKVVNNRVSLNDLIIPKTHTEDFTFTSALAHLVSIDPRFIELESKHKCELFNNLETPVDPFESLMSSIISQQISGAAAKSIKRRFIDLFDSRYTFPSPAQVLTQDIPTLRAAGLSGRKAEYVLDLAAKFNSGEINPHALTTLSDDEVIELLVKVRGLGVWSAEMFLIFALKRPDVFSIGDLGVQRGMAVWAGKNIALAKGKKGKFKYMTEQEMIERSEPFRPYRSLFMWYMWRASDVIVPITD
ncbi:DNA glycosylase [Lipomyces arxii]|uniref:DNA glycosylase n=1 Tax=Lipomyces arxii TaxID=56418 RepID=UPI0034CFD087